MPCRIILFAQHSFINPFVPVRKLMPGIRRRIQ